MSVSPTLDRAKWLEERRGYLGGTDLAAIVGMNRWSSPLKVYLSKKGEVEDTSGPLAQMGTILEPFVASEFTRLTAHKLVESPTVRHPKYPFIAGNPDRLLAEEPDELLEIKTYGYSTAEEWGEEGTDQIPPHYFVQGTVYMGLTGRKVCHYAALHRDKGTVALYEARFDRELFDMVVAAGVDFWHNAIEKDARPDPTAQDLEYLKEKFPTDHGGMVIANWNVEQAVERMAAAKIELDRNQKIFDDGKALIQAFMGENSLCETMAGGFTWRKAKDSTSVDWHKVAREMCAHVASEIDDADAVELLLSSYAAQFTATKPGSRRFLTPFKGES